MSAVTTSSPGDLRPAIFGTGGIGTYHDYLMSNEEMEQVREENKDYKWNTHHHIHRVLLSRFHIKYPNVSPKGVLLMPDYFDAALLYSQGDIGGSTDGIQCVSLHGVSIFVKHLVSGKLVRLCSFKGYGLYSYRKRHGVLPAVTRTPYRKSVMTRAIFDGTVTRLLETKGLTEENWRENTRRCIGSVMREHRYNTRFVGHLEAAEVTNLSNVVTSYNRDPITYSSVKKAVKSYQQFRIERHWIFLITFLILLLALFTGETGEMAYDAINRININWFNVKMSFILGTFAILLVSIFTTYIFPVTSPVGINRESVTHRHPNTVIVNHNISSTHPRNSKDGIYYPNRHNRLYKFRSLYNNIIDQNHGLERIVIQGGNSSESVPVDSQQTRQDFY
jgi:hypothetical protein